MKTKSKCARFLDGLKLNLTDDDKAVILDKMIDFIKKGPRQVKQLDFGNEMKNFLDKMYHEYRIELANRTKIALLNLDKRATITKRLEGWGDDILEGLLALARGSNRQIAGARFSIDSAQKHMSSDWSGKFLLELQQHKVLSILTSGKRDKEIMEEIYNVFKGLKRSDDPKINKIADIINKFDNEMVNRLNAAGAMIQRNPGFMFRMSVDRAKVRLAKFPKWFKDSEQFFDKKMIEANTDVPYETFMRKVYEDYASGKFLANEFLDEGTVPLGYLSSTANLARKVSRTNRMVFKDGAAHFEYLKLYGDPSAHVRNSILFSFEHSGRNVALMEMLGPNPKHMLRSIIAELKPKLRSRNMDQYQKDFAGQERDGLPRKLSDAFNELDGTTRIPGSESGAKFGAVTRTLANMARLGNIVIRSINDFPVLLSEAHYQGIPFMRAMKMHWDSVMALYSDSDQRHIASLVGFGQDVLQSDVITAFTFDNMLPGTWSNAQRRYFKLNGIAYWNNALKSAFAAMQAQHLGNHAHLPFDQLPFKLKRVLKTFDIDGNDWAMLRSTVYETRGYKVVTPDMMDDVSDATWARYLDAKKKKPEDIESVPIGEQLKEAEDFDKATARIFRFDNKITREGYIQEKAAAIADEDAAIVIEKKVRVIVYDLEQDLKRLQDQLNIDPQDTILKAEIKKKKAELKTQRANEDRVRKKTDIATKFKEQIEKSKYDTSKYVPPEQRILAPKFSKAQADRAKYELSQKLGSFYQDRNDYAIIIPGVREKAFFHRGHQPGTVDGEAARFIAQFKSFPLSVFTKGIERDILAGGARTLKEGLTPLGAKQGELLSLMAFIGGMSAYGALGTMATDRISHLRTQRDWTKLETYMHAAIQGGAFGLYTDFVFGAYGDGDNWSHLKNVLGPVLGNYDSAYSVLQGALGGDVKAKQIVNLLYGFTPGANLFYTRALTDYMIWYELKETVDPGFLRRMERNLFKRTGQEFLIPPSGQIPHGGSYF